MLMQRGLVLWRCGRTDEALEAYRRALPTLRRGKDRLMEARLYNNRSLLYIDRGELAAAEADLLRVAALARAEGQAGMAADAETNLGYLNLRRGDVPAALGFLDSAEATYRAQAVRPARAAAHPRRAAAVGGRVRRGTADRGAGDRPADRGRLAVPAGRGAAAAVPGAAGR
jgi:tetratricopeptide (TPR) repeat protein